MSLAVLYTFLKAKVKSPLAFVCVRIFIIFFLTLQLCGKSGDCNSNACWRHLTKGVANSHAPAILSWYGNQCCRLLEVWDWICRVQPFQGSFQVLLEASERRYLNTFQCFLSRLLSTVCRDCSSPWTPISCVWQGTSLPSALSYGFEDSSGTGGKSTICIVGEAAWHKMTALRSHSATGMNSSR